MKKPTKILLGLATLWPFFYLILFFVVIFSTIVFMPGPGGEESGPPPLIALILPLHLLTMLAVMMLMVFYIVNVFRNARVDKDKKALWAVVLFMGNMIAMPIYWYLYIWRETSAIDSPPPSVVGSADAADWAHDTTASNREQQYAPPSQPPNWRE
jgi:hypothetical protein